MLSRALDPVTDTRRAALRRACFEGEEAGNHEKAHTLTAREFHYEPGRRASEADLVAESEGCSPLLGDQVGTVSVVAESRTEEPCKIRPEEPDGKLNPKDLIQEEDDIFVEACIIPEELLDRQNTVRIGGRICPAVTYAKTRMVRFAGKIPAPNRDTSVRGLPTPRNKQ